MLRPDTRPTLQHACLPELSASLRSPSAQIQLSTCPQVPELPHILCYGQGNAILSGSTEGIFNSSSNEKNMMSVANNRNHQANFHHPKQIIRKP